MRTIVFAPGSDEAQPAALPVESTGLILAGGRSRRMGTPKALLPVGEGTLLSTVFDQLRRRCTEVYVVVRRAEREAFPGFPVIPDEVDDQGPLMGLCSGLEASRTQVNLLIACDIPIVDPRLLDLLLACGAEYDIAFASLPGHGGDQPLLGMYKREVRLAARRLLAGGCRRIVELFPLFHTARVRVEESDWYANLNTPAEYKDFLNRTVPSAEEAARGGSEARARGEG